MECQKFFLMPHRINGTGYTYYFTKNINQTQVSHIYTCFGRCSLSRPAGLRATCLARFASERSTNEVGCFWAATNTGMGCRKGDVFFVLKKDMGGFYHGQISMFFFNGILPQPNA